MSADRSVDDISSSPHFPSYNNLYSSLKVNETLMTILREIHFRLPRRRRVTRLSLVAGSGAIVIVTRSFVAPLELSPISPAARSSHGLLALPFLQVTIAQTDHQRHEVKGAVSESRASRRGRPPTLKSCQLHLTSDDYTIETTELPECPTITMIMERRQ